MKINTHPPTRKAKVRKPMSPVPHSATSSDETVSSGPPALPVEYLYGYDYDLPQVEEV